MGAGVYDIVVGLDEAVFAAAVGAAFAQPNQPTPTYSAQDASGDNWTFTVPIAGPSVSLTGSSQGQAQATLTLTPQIVASDTTNPAKSFEAGVTIQCTVSLVFEPPTLTLDVSFAQASTADPGQSQLLNQVVMPWLASYLNSLMPSLTVPAFQIEGVALAPPALGVDSTTAGQNVLLIFTGINPVTVPDSGTGVWPVASMFVAVDAALLTAAAHLPYVTGSGEHSSISYDYQASPQLSAVVLQPGAGNAVTAQVIASGPFNLEWHTPSGFPNVYFSGNYDGNGTATVDVLVATQGGYPSMFDISVKIAAVSGVSVDVQVGDIPIPDASSGILGGILGGLGVPDVPIASISDEIGSAISNAVTGSSFDVGALWASANVAAGLSLQFSNPAVTQFAAPGGVPLLAVTATASW